MDLVVVVEGTNVSSKIHAQHDEYGKKFKRN